MRHGAGNRRFHLSNAPFCRVVGKKEIPISLREIHKYSEEIPIYLGDLPISLKEICISFAEVDKFPGDLHKPKRETSSFSLGFTVGMDRVLPNSVRLGVRDGNRGRK